MIKNLFSRVVFSDFYLILSIIGFIIFLYNVFNYFFSYKESTELIIYFFLYFLIFSSFILINLKSSLNIFYNFKIIEILRFSFSFLFILFIVLNYNFEYLHLYFIFLSFLLTYTQLEKSNWILVIINNLDKVFLYFFLMYFSSLVFYWEGIDNIIFRKIDVNSKYANIALYIEIITPIFFFISTLIPIYIFYKFKSFFEYINDKKIVIFLLIIFFSIFFIESFSTYGFFSSYGGGPLYHWQSLVGPNQMLQQGGHLLWDSPSTYGYLNHILIDLIPIKNKWLSFYYVNSFLTFTLSIIIFYTFWYLKNFNFLILAFLLTYVVIFLMPAANSSLNIASTPAGGAFRYFWIIILLFCMVKLRNINFIKQFAIIYLIYIIGFLWSFESAFFLSSAMLPYFLHHVIFDKLSIQKFFIFLTIPISIAIICIFLIIYYQNTIGVFPDFFMFAEYAINNTKGYFSNQINNFENLIIHFSILIIICIYSYKNKFNYLFFSIILSLWSISSIYVGQSHPISLLKLFVFYLFGLFLVAELLHKNVFKNYLFKIFAILLIIIPTNLSNPAIINHLYYTINNQDYDFSNINHEFDESVYLIIENLNLDTSTPIYFIERSRYLNLVNISYNYENNINLISDTILFPFYPPAVILDKKKERSIIFKKRWLKKIDKLNIDDAYLIIPTADYYWSVYIRDLIIEDNNHYKILFIDEFSGYDIFKLNFRKS